MTLEEIEMAAYQKLIEMGFLHEEAEILAKEYTIEETLLRLAESEEDDDIGFTPPAPPTYNA